MTGGDPHRILGNVVRAYIGAVAAAGLAMSAYAIANSRLDPLPVLLFCAAAAIAEGLQVAVTEEAGVAISLSLAVIIAAVVALGPGAAVLTAFSAGAAIAIVRRPRPELRKTVFNLGLFTLQGGAAGLAYRFVAGGTGGHWLTAVSIEAGLVALAVAVAVNWALLIGVIHLTSGRSFRDIWDEDLRWMPIQVGVAGLIGYSMGGAFVLYGLVGPVVYLAPLLALRHSMRSYTAHMRKQVNELRAAHAETDNANQRLSATNEGLLKTLAAVIDARDIYLYGHSVQASLYAKQVATKLELGQEDVRLAELGALLHDIGKIGVSETILNKPARLTESEYDEVKNHCEIGYELLSNLPEFEDVANIVRSHHERYDGKGYPRGLRGKQIPVGARIVSVVEAVEAMVSDRPYRKGLTAEQVLQELADGSGTQWDPDVVEAFSGILSVDRRHLVMRNSALEVALSRQPLGELLSQQRQPGTISVRDMSETFRTAAQPIFILDERLQVVSINAAAEVLMGATELELQQRSWEELVDAQGVREKPHEYFAEKHHLSVANARAERVEIEVTGTTLPTNGAVYWLVMAHDVTQRVKVESELKRQVGTDYLTQLSSREELERRAADLIAAGNRPLTLALLDLDRLKSINDTHGHLAGDDALKTLARCLSSELRSADVGARLAGDEFAILMPGSTADNARRALHRIETSVQSLQGDFGIEFCSGVATWEPDDTFADLLRRADAALYEQKRSRPGDVIPLRASELH